MNTLMTLHQPTEDGFRAGPATRERSFWIHRSRRAHASRGQSSMAGTRAASGRSQDAIGHSRRPVHDAVDSGRVSLATPAVHGASVPPEHRRQAAPAFHTREPVRRWNQWPRETAPLGSSCNGTGTSLSLTTEKDFKRIFDRSADHAARTTFHSRAQPRVHSPVVCIPVHSSLSFQDRLIRQPFRGTLIRSELFMNNRTHARRVA